MFFTIMYFRCLATGYFTFYFVTGTNFLYITVMPVRVTEGKEKMTISVREQRKENNTFYPSKVCLVMS